jgi:hypothetical protein
VSLPTVCASVARSCRSRLAIDWADDAGQVAGIEVLPFGILIFVIGALLIGSSWAVIDTKMAVNAATREGVRTFVEADDPVSGTTNGTRVAREAIAGYGRNPDKLRVDPPDYHGGSFRRCNLVTIHASYPAPLIALPLIGSHGEAFTVTSSHTEMIDPYRSGLGGASAC